MEFLKNASSTNFTDNKGTYYMFVDENNSGILEYAVKCHEKGEQITDDNRYFVLTGCIINKEEYELLKDEFETLKYELWQNGIYYDEKTEDYRKVCFHSVEIRRRCGSFRADLVNHELLCEKINEVISKINFKIISIAIDVNEYMKKMKEINIYNIGMSILMDKFVETIEQNKNGSIILEARGKKEDNEVYNYMKECILNTGTKKHLNTDLKQHILGVYFNKKYSNDKKITYCGLELADLCSYPIYKYIKTGEKDMAFKCIENKILGYPNYEEKGIIKLK